ncbi:TPA: phage major capsid protein, partial [Enterococcus faecium]
QILLDAHKLHVAIKVTDELLYDNAFNLENYIIDQFTKALANAEEDAFLNGDGVGKPLGIFAATGGGQVAITTNTQSAVTADDVVNLVYALKRPYRKNAKFIMNDQTISLLRKLKDNNGAYMWQPALVAGEPDRLLGYPVYTSEFVPTVKAGAPVIAFGDFSYYNIGDRGVRSFDQLRELFAGNGMVGFLAKERVDGKLVLPEAVQILKMKASASS